MMTELSREQNEVDRTDRLIEQGRNGQGLNTQPGPSPDGSGSWPVQTYVVRLRLDLQMAAVTRLLRYISDFGVGHASAHALDGGWCIRLSSVTDLRVFSSQCAELIEGHVVEYSEDFR